MKRTMTIVLACLVAQIRTQMKHNVRVQKLLAILLGAIFSCGALPAFADSLPKAEEGYQYYCTGVRAKPSLDRPNAFIAFKLRKADVSYDRND